ncbi:cytochrome-c peroxidase [Pseudothauera rhizosphaerae]|uniref:Cytochrome-c peroxidase n=1 Tax=Pseudothauera rhizosphaerae TaxID=2565932 RepID=A0A4V3W9W1_9RHOO|nr:cytochrome c peroxidase [Pseudothauera rhizosphaerae]THF56865.1 cytochrome-c peroxidase [Pseudothauera rhizosphaerae]
MKQPPAHPLIRRACRRGARLAALAGALLAWPAAAACTLPDDGWDAACLRAVYTRDIAHWPPPQGVDRTDWREMAPVGTLAAPAPQPTRAALGERLFFDPRLSRSDLLACVSCHRPGHGFADTQAVSAGHEGRLGTRNAPTVLGAAHAPALFWDGRAATLEAQASGPIAHPDEMAMPLDELPGKLAALDDYEAAFTRAFAGESAGNGQGAVTLARIAAALAAYQRTLLPPETRFDRFLAGERGALDDRELLGLHLFRTKGRCMTCHDGPLLTDNRFHNLGLTWYGRQYEDLGRYGVTGDPVDVGRFRTPTLRQVAHTGPWMHNGRFPSLRGILNMYNAGMPQPKPANAEQARDPLFPKTSELLRPLDLTPEELDALEAFLAVL